MSEPLIIVGAGGHGRETAFVHLLAAPKSSFLGFLDDVPGAMTPEGWPVLGTIDRAIDHRHARFIVAVNDPRVRRSIVRRLESLGIDRWGTVVHPDVRMHTSTKLGQGCAVLGGCNATVNIQVGDHCILNRLAQVGHDCIIGAFCSLNPSACMAGNVTVGEGCELGSGCLVRQGTRVGAGATIGMGAIVIRDVEPRAVMVGNPARVLRSNAPW